MKFSLPDPTKFDIHMLAKRWGCSTEQINDYVKSQKLQVVIKDLKETVISSWMMREIDREYFTLEEVLRFEAEHSSIHDLAATDIEYAQSSQKALVTSKLLPGEKPADYVDRRRSENVSDSEIALELREIGVFWSAIGKALCPINVMIGDKTTPAKRAKSLIRKLDKSFKERIKGIFSEKEFSEWLKKK